MPLRAQYLSKHCTSTLSPITKALFISDHRMEARWARLEQLRPTPYRGGSLRFMLIIQRTIASPAFNYLSARGLRDASTV